MPCSHGKQAPYFQCRQQPGKWADQYREVRPYPLKRKPADRRTQRRQDGFTEIKLAQIITDARMSMRDIRKSTYTFKIGLTNPNFPEHAREISADDLLDARP